MWVTPHNGCSRSPDRGTSIKDGGSLRWAQGVQTQKLQEQIMGTAPNGHSRCADEGTLIRDGGSPHDGHSRCAWIVGTPGVQIQEHPSTNLTKRVQDIRNFSLFNSPATNNEVSVFGKLTLEQGQEALSAATQFRFTDINPKSFHILNVHSDVSNNVQMFKPCFLFFTNLQSDFGGVQGEGEQVSYTSCCASTNKLHSRGGRDICGFEANHFEVFYFDV